MHMLREKLDLRFGVTDVPLLQINIKDHGSYDKAIAEFGIRSHQRVAAQSGAAIVRNAAGMPAFIPRFGSSRSQALR